MKPVIEPTLLSLFMISAAGRCCVGQGAGRDYELLKERTSTDMLNGALGVDVDP